MPGAQSLSLLSFFEWLGQTPGSSALHGSLYLYPLVESVHVLCLCLFVGLSTMLDLRLLGWALRRVPVSEVITRLLPWMIGGFVVMVITGVLLVYGIPVRSYQNIFFRFKVGLLVLAGVNAWAFHAGIHRRVAEWDRTPVPPRRARMAGAISLVLWGCIIVAGRMIAYNWFDCDQPQSAIVTQLAGCVVK